MIIQKLKEACKTNNWKLVAEVVLALDGTVVSVSDPNKSVLVQIEELRRQVLAGFTSVPETVECAVIQAPVVSPIKKKRGRKPSVKSNLFETMDLKIEKEVGEDLINDNVPRVPRTRGSSEVTMTCDTCGKKEQVSKIFARELYKCDKCLLEMGKNGPK